MVCAILAATAQDSKPKPKTITPVKTPDLPTKPTNTQTKNYKKEYDYVWELLSQEGLLVVKKDDKYGFIDNTYKEVIPLIYDGAGAFSEGLANVKKNNKWGYIDKDNRTVIPFIYTNTGNFSKGKALVEKNGELYFINKEGICIEECP